MIIKAVKPGEDINENDQLIFFVGIHFLKFIHRTYARGHVVPVRQLRQQSSGSVQKKIRIINNLFR